MSDKHPPSCVDGEMGEDDFDQEIEGCDEENIEDCLKTVHEEQSECCSMQVSDSTTQTEACRDCRNHKKTIHHLKNQVIGLRTCLRKQRNLAWMYRKRKH